MIRNRVVAAVFHLVLAMAVIASVMVGNATTTMAATGEITKLVLSKNELSLETGDSASLSATALYENGASEDATIKTEWTSSDSSVASVYAGNVTAKGEGTATITATYLTKVVVVNVKVVKKVRSLSMDKQSINIRKGAKEQIKLTAVYTDGITEEVTTKATWTVDQYAIASVINGEVVGMGSGTATVTAKLGSQSVTIPVSVEVVRRLDPGKTTISLPVKGFEDVALYATFADGTVEDVAAKAEWVSDKDSIADAINGKVTAYGTGEAVITAKYGTKTTTIKVEAGISRRLDVDKKSLFLKVNGTEQLELTSTNADGNGEKVTDKADWTSADESVVWVSKGKVTALKSGETTITASYGGKSVTIIVYVDVPRKLEANKQTVSLQPGETDKLTLYAYFEDGRKDEITQDAEWTTSSAAVAEVRQGIITAIGAGSTTITAKYGKRLLTIPVNVGLVKSLTADQTKVVLAKDKTSKVKVTVEYADGLKKDVTDQATWATGQASVATVENGLITAVGSGKTTVTATFEGKTVSIAVEVDQAQTLSANYKLIVMSTGETKQIVITAVAADGKSRDVTEEAEWVSGNQLAVEVTKGLVRGLANGKSTVIAKYGGQSISIPVEVGIVTRMDLNKRFLNFKTGDTLYLKLTVTLSDGSTKDVSADAEWKTGNYKVADIDSKGLVTATGPGKTNITVRYANKMMTVPIEVDVLKYLKTDVVKVEMKVGETKKVKATATFTDGTETDITIPALWTTSRILVADVKDGIIKATGQGTTTISVSYAGKRTTVVVIVRP
ncbi:MAG: Ig-like domain-containing protein [Clostridia bacterium]